MRYLAVKDHNRRLLYKKNYFKRLVLKYYVINCSNNLLKFYYMSKLSKINRNSSKVRIKDRCIITFRANTIFKSKLSRFTLKKYAELGILNGYKKSSW